MYTECAYNCGHTFQDLYLPDSDEEYTCPVCNGVNYLYSYEYTFQWPDGYRPGIVYYCSLLIHNPKNTSGDIDAVMLKITDLDEHLEPLPIPRYVHFIRVAFYELKK